MPTRVAPSTLIPTMSALPVMKRTRRSLQGCPAARPGPGRKRRTPRSAPTTTAYGHGCAPTELVLDVAGEGGQEGAEGEEEGEASPGGDHRATRGGHCRVGAGRWGSSTAMQGSSTVARSVVAAGERRRAPSRYHDAPLRREAPRRWGWPAGIARNST